MVSLYLIRRKSYLNHAVFTLYDKKLKFHYNNRFRNIRKQSSRTK